MVTSLLALWLTAATPAAVTDAAYLRDHGTEPAAYVASKVDAYRVVLLGEGHWTKHDAELVAALVPLLREKEAVLGVEMFAAADQETLDALVTAESWDEARAMGVLRRAAWPYREYLEIIHAAWRANRGDGPDFRILGLGPGSDFRRTLPAGQTYDGFMADRVIEALRGGAKHVVVYAGIHHAFTRYEQPELDLRGRAYAFMDRTGNILRRRLGERVFLIALHRPVWCGAEEPWGSCLPLDGAIDCAALAGGRPVAFDVHGSPFGAMTFDPLTYYARGYPSLRLVDFSDGWIWTRPVEEYELVGLIPLDEFAPDPEALEEVRTNPPFGGERPAREELEAAWAQEEARRSGGLAARGWSALADWRSACPAP